MLFLIHYLKSSLESSQTEHCQAETICLCSIPTAIQNPWCAKPFDSRNYLYTREEKHRVWSFPDFCFFF